MTLAAFFLVGFALRYSANLIRPLQRDRLGTERPKKIAGSGSFPSLTQQMNVSPTPPASPTPSPTLTATKPAK